MAMTAFEIFGVLKLDKTDFDNGIKEAQNGTDKLFNLESAKTAINGVNKFGDSIIGIGRNAMNTSASFESAFTGVRKTVDATEEEYSALSDWILEASTRMASSKNDIAATMEIAGQLGVSGVEGLEKFTETMIMLGDTTNLNAEEAASSLAKFGNIAGLAPTDMDRIGAVIVDLGNHFATTESDIVAMSSRLASAGTIAGFSSTDILALSTAMSSVGINAEAGGTAMSTIMTKIGRAVDEGIDPSNKKLDLFAKTAGMSSEEFVAAWKTSPTTALQNFVKGLDGMVDSGDNVTAVLDDLGIKGIRETNTIKSLALASDVLTGAVDMANNAFEENSALTNEANLRYGTTESKMMQTQEAMSNLALELGDRLLPLIDKGISVMSELMKIWDSLSDGTKDAIVNIGLVLGVGSKLIAGIGSVALGINSIITVVGTLIPALAGIAPVILPIIAIIAAVIAIGVVLYKNWDTIKEKAGELWAKIKEVFENIKLIVSATIQALKIVITQAVETFKGKINQIKEFFSGLFTSIKNTVSNIINSIKNFKENIKNTFNSIKDSILNIINNLLSSALNWGRDLIQNFIDGIKEKFQAVKNTLTNLGDLISGFIHFSEPDEGPLSNFHTYAPDMMDLFIKGIKDNEDKLKDQMASTFDFGNFVTMPGTDNASVGAGSGFNNAINITINSAAGQDVRELADIVSRRVAYETRKQAEAWGIA